MLERVLLQGELVGEGVVDLWVDRIVIERFAEAAALLRLQAPEVLAGFVEAESDEVGGELLIGAGFAGALSFSAVTSGFSSEVSTASFFLGGVFVHPAEIITSA